MYNMACVRLASTQCLVVLQDAYRSPLTFGAGKVDTMTVALLRAVDSGPQESQLVASVEQALPLVQSWLNFNRLHARAERTFSTFINPFKLRLCGKGAGLSNEAGVLLCHVCQTYMNASCSMCSNR